LILTPNYTLKKFKESTLNLCFLVGSLRKSASALNFFSNTQNLKLLYSEVLIKTQYLRCWNFKIFKIQEPPNSGLEGRKDVVFHGSILKQHLHLVG